MAAGFRSPSWDGLEIGATKESCLTLWTFGEDSEAHPIKLFFVEEWRPFSASLFFWPPALSSQFQMSCASQTCHTYDCPPRSPRSLNSSRLHCRGSSSCLIPFFVWMTSEIPFGRLWGTICCSLSRSLQTQSPRTSLNPKPARLDVSNYSCR